MATCNFPAINASRYFVFELEDPYLLNCELEAIRSEICRRYDFDPVDDHTGSRSHPGNIFAEKEIKLCFGGQWLATAKIQAVIYYGYYSEVCFDWRVEIIDSCSAVYDLDEIEIPAEDEIKAAYGAGFAKIHTTTTARRWVAQIAQETDRLESCFDRFATSKLVRVGTFSSGAAVYVEA